MADFLLELRCEEIPARMQAGARAELEKLFRRELEAAGVRHDNLRIWSTPRRLALIAYDMPDATEAVSEEAKGPPEGAPDAAIDGFCKKAGVTRDQLELRDVKGRMTYFAVVATPGRPMAEVLAAAIPAIIRDFSWPKSMRWGAASITTDSLRWVRPLSGIVALLDDAVIDVEVGGIRSGRETMGHRFQHSGPIAIESAHTYASQLLAARVIVEHTKREGLIRLEAAKAAAEAGLTLIADEGLVIENAGLTENPVPLLGRFDEAFLDVPPEVIQLTARVNQKYFVCEDADGKLANAFVCTANIAPIDPAVVVDGNRKVLAARLSDARFFWEQDQKTPLAVHAEKLSRITFHEKLGTVADKVERVAKLARWLCEEGIILPGTGRGTVEDGGGDSPPAPSHEASPLHHPADGPPPLAGEERARLADLAEQAARLCKADLVTEMVGEFPELQGLMGGYYAAKEGLPQEVAEAIRDHYKPVGQGDDVPTAPVTVAVSLADKLDTVFEFFSIGEKPTGSKDPFALRRQAIAANALVVQNQLNFSVFDTLLAHGATLLRQNTMMDKALYAKVRKKAEWIAQDRSEVLGDQHVLVAATQILSAELIGFFGTRLQQQLKAEGKRTDFIDAALYARAEKILALHRTANALQDFLTTEDGTNLLAGYKRAANILKKEGFQSPLPLRGGAGGGDSPKAPGQGDSPHPNPSPEGEGLETLSYTPEEAEKALIDALDTAAPRAAQAVAEERFADAMAALATLRAPIDRFFEEVTVNDPQADKRAARLALLARFRDAVHRVADFSRIEG